MTKTEFEVAKVYEEELLHCFREVERIKAKLMEILDDGNGALLDIEFNTEEDCLRYVSEGADDDYIGLQLEFCKSVEEMKKEKWFEVEEEVEENAEL